MCSRPLVSTSPSVPEQAPVWKRYDLVHPKDKNGQIMLQPSADQLSNDDMFETLVFYTRQRSVVGASTGAGSDKENINGIVQVGGYSSFAVLPSSTLARLRLFSGARVQRSGSQGNRSIQATAAAQSMGQLRMEGELERQLAAVEAIPEGEGGGGGSDWAMDLICLLNSFAILRAWSLSATSLLPLTRSPKRSTL